MGRNHRGAYPADWKAIAKAVKDAADWRCVRCGHPHEPPKRRIACDDRCDPSKHPEWEPATERSAVRCVGATHIRDEQGLTWCMTGQQRARVLTVAHLDDDKSNCNDFNLVALCQVCHLVTQSRIEMHRPWVLDHSAWMRPYVAGFYARKYLGLDLTRVEVDARIDELLGLERAALGMETP